MKLRKNKKNQSIEIKDETCGESQDQTLKLETKQEASVRGIIPLLIFVILFVAVGCILDLFKANINSIQDPMGFYLIFSPIFTIIPLIVGFLIIRIKFSVKISAVLKGAANENILIMVFIYLLSGMFSNIMTTIGASSAVAFLGFKIISPAVLVGGVFVISSILSTAMGTSVGTIVAFGPIVFSLAKYSSSSVNSSMLGGALLCGAMFGDDLSMVSDTAIASCRTQHVSPKERFLFNFKMLAIPAIIALILYFVLGRSKSHVVSTDHWMTWEALVTIIPFVIVIITALCEVNVFVVLLIGVISAIIVGFALGHVGHWTNGIDMQTNYAPGLDAAHFNADTHHFDTKGTLIDTGLDRFLVGMNSLKDGMLSMGEVIFLALLTGALSGLCNSVRGMEWLMAKFGKCIRGKKSAELSIGCLTSIIDICLANNTIAIILSGDMVYEIRKKYKLNKNKIATFTSVFPAIFQGLIPYGAQMLMMISLANQQLMGIGQISFVSVWAYCWYLYLLFAACMALIFIPPLEKIVNYKILAGIKVLCKKRVK